VGRGAGRVVNLLQDKGVRMHELIKTTNPMLYVSYNRVGEKRQKRFNR